MQVNHAQPRSRRTVETEGDQTTQAPSPLSVGIDLGDGRPLVLIPGYGMQPDVYLGTTRLLAERCRVVLIDIYAIRGPWRDEEVARSLSATLDRLELQRASFLVHSFGGGIELRFAVQHPERVVELIFSDTLAVSCEWALADEAMSHPLRLLGMTTPRAACLPPILGDAPSTAG